MLNGSKTVAVGAAAAAAAGPSPSDSPTQAEHLAVPGNASTSKRRRKRFKSADRSPSSTEVTPRVNRAKSMDPVDPRYALSRKCHIFVHFIFWLRYCWIFQFSVSLVDWGCRIHRLHLCRVVTPQPQQVSWIWHKTIWWWGSSNAGALGNVEYPFIAIAPRSTLAWSGSTW